MVKRAQSLSNFFLVVSLLLTFFQCQQKTPEATSIPGVFESVDQDAWTHANGQLLLKNKPFSGWQYQLWTNGDTAYVGAFSEGKAEGIHRQWYANHKPKEVRQYRNGWQEDEQRGWHESGKPSFVYRFQNDVYEGNVKEWYVNGQPARDGNYHEGQEAGSQRQWFADGTLKFNYVARNGRNYGFTGVKNCVNVWDSISVSH
ncbi:hypothetical protein GCM10028805_12920 [Spirosoma harenae]